MNLDKIRIFLEGVKLGSFSKAAEKYAYTPSALSHIADSIEQELGVKLIERAYNGITLTKEGEQMLPFLNRLLQAEEDLLTIAKRLQTKELTLSIGCYASISQHLLPEIIVAFKKANPNVQVSIVVGNSFADMTEKKADVFFIEEQEAPSHTFTHVYADEYVAVVREEYFLSRKVLHKEDLKKYPLILPVSHDIYTQFENAAPDVVNVSSDDDASVVSMVKNGLGISILPALSVKNPPKGVKTIAMQPKIQRNLGIFYPNTIKNPAAKKFLNFITTV